MRSILQKKALRFVFGANVVSMIGSGMNSAAVAWYILQATHSEIALGTFAVVQTLPAILLLVFGVIWLYDKSRGGYKAEQIVPGAGGVAPAVK